MNRKAFTLIEFMVVFAIVMVGVALIVPAIMAVKNLRPVEEHPLQRPISVGSIELPLGAEIVQEMGTEWVIFDVQVPLLGGTEKETQRFMLYHGGRLGQEALTVLPRSGQ